MVEAGRFGSEDATVLALLPAASRSLLVANKLDTVTRRADLAPWLQAMQAGTRSPSSCRSRATKAADAQRLLGIVEPYLPEQAWLHDADALTDRSDRFLGAEIVREKLFRLTGDELPYTSTVVIDRYEEEGTCAASPRPSSSSASRTRG